MVVSTTELGISLEIESAAESVIMTENFSLGDTKGERVISTTSVAVDFPTVLVMKAVSYEVRVKVIEYDSPMDSGAVT